MENLFAETLPGGPLDPAQLNPTPEIKNESPTAASPTTEDSSLKKIISAATGAYQSVADTIRPGRGRPRKDGSPKISDKIGPIEKLVEANLPLQPLVVAPPVNSAGDLLFRRSVTAAIAGIGGIGTTVLRTKAKAAGIDPDFTNKALAECAPEKEVVDGFNEALGLVMEKYNFTTKFGPEIALGIYGARIAAPFGLLLKTFNDEIARKRALEKQTNGNNQP